MADEEKEVEEQEEEGKGLLAGRKRIIIFGAIGLVALIAIGSGAYFFLSSDEPAPEVTQQAPAEPAGAGTTPAPVTSPLTQAAGGGPADQIGPMVDIDSFIVNLLDLDSTRYLKASLTLELNSSAAAEEVAARMTQIRDAILLLCGNKTYAELRDLQGKMQLRAELIGHLNTFLQKGQVKKIYFTNFVIQ